MISNLNVIENPAYHKWNWIDGSIRFNWIRNIGLHDDAICNEGKGSVLAGRVEMINNYGIEISTPEGYKYITFPNVLKVIKYTPQND